MLLATALALLITGCTAQMFTVQNNRAAVAPVKPSLIIFVSGIGQKKTVDAAKICGGAENVVKTETQQNIRKIYWFGFITLGIYTRRKVVLSLLYELPIDMGNSICTAHYTSGFLPEAVFA